MTDRSPRTDLGILRVRGVTFEEINDPKSPWPAGFRPNLSECPVTHEHCVRGCADMCRVYQEFAS